MAIQDFLSHPDWDKPFFKRLPSNDTGGAPGHQGGMVIPKELRRFFPGLVGRITATTPTIDRRIWADLHDGERFLARVNTRYQFQTWGGARSPESRLTDNLSALRNLAQPEDILIIQRSLIELDLYRLTLIRKTSGDFGAIDAVAGKTRWGVLGKDFPMTEDDFDEALMRQTGLEEKPFTLFDADAKVLSSTVTRLARSMVFKQRVTEIYSRSCCVCRSGLQVPAGPIEVEAAHIVPRRLFGSDDARNGLGLCRRHHWAFDLGLFGVDTTRLVCVPPRVLHLTENRSLQKFAGQPIVEATEKSLRASDEALAWHMKHVVLN